MTEQIFKPIIMTFPSIKQKIMSASWVVSRLKSGYVRKHLACAGYLPAHVLSEGAASGGSYGPDFLIQTKISGECSNCLFIMEFSQIERCSGCAYYEEIFIPLTLNVLSGPF